MKIAHVSTRRRLARIAIGVMLCSAAGTLAQPPANQGLAHWREVYSVLTHPRCINCHTITDYPRQGDDRHPHKFGVVRGRHGKGVAGQTCATCHLTSNNDASGVPGGPAWHLAPLAMAWESRPGIAMTSGRLCATLKNRAKNGDHTLTELAEHHETEALVHWAWSPGARSDGSARSMPALTHEQFVTAFNAWVKAGAPCPPAAKEPG